MTAITQDKATLAIREAAADWIIRLDVPTLTTADKTEFAAWLCRSPVHVTENLRAEAAWAALSGAALRRTDDVQAILSQAETNIIPLPAAPKSAVSSAPSSVRGSSFRNKAIAAAAVLLIAVCALLLPMLMDRLGSSTYTTAIGEQRRVMLPDGSAIELNTHSKVRVRISAAAREIELAEGEAFFDVAKDPARPFTVRSGATVVRAVGTQFNVYRETDSTVVTVVEGRVAVSPLASNGESKLVTPSSGSLLVAGDRAQITSDASIKRTSVDAQHATAWRQRRLVFENETLAEVVTEMNRYNVQQLVVEDTALAAERLSGVFAPDKPRALISFLSRNGGIQVIERTDHTWLLTRVKEPE